MQFYYEQLIIYSTVQSVYVEHLEIAGIFIAGGFGTTVVLLGYCSLNKAVSSAMLS